MNDKSKLVPRLCISNINIGYEYLLILLPIVHQPKGKLLLMCSAAA